MAHALFPAGRSGQDRLGFFLLALASRLRQTCGMINNELADPRRVLRAKWHINDGKVKLRNISLMDKHELVADLIFDLDTGERTEHAGEESALFDGWGVSKEQIQAMAAELVKELLK